MSRSSAPFADPFTTALSTPHPHLKPHHAALRAYTRNWVETHLSPHAAEWESTGQIPRSTRTAYANAGFSIARPCLSTSYTGGITPPAGIHRDQWDSWCSYIVADEMNRLGCCGVTWGLGGGNGIGAPPVARFGTERQKERWLPRIARGEVVFCLGVTEPGGGSDVADLRTTAVKKGDVYVVNGAKKWITCGMWADYMTAAVRTGGDGSGAKGLSLLVVPLGSFGVRRTKIENQGVNASGSALIVMEDVEVPVDNLLGKENDGWSMIMSNFNPERLALATAALRLSRVCLEDAYGYACERRTFGRALVEHEIVRAKFAEMALLIEPAHAFLEQLIAIVEAGRVNGIEVNVGGMTALLKVMSTRCLEKCCREAQQIFGGAAYSKSGRGARVERISRDVRVHVVGGGSEEIMTSLAVRQEARDVQLRAKQMSKL